jgi:hypothetical protein
MTADVDLFAAEAAAQLPEGHAKEGLASDYWWKDEPLTVRAAARRWVKWRLLILPLMSDAHADRFIASLSPGKRADLIKRAVDGTGPEGF